MSSSHARDADRNQSNNIAIGYPVPLLPQSYIHVRIGETPAAGDGTTSAAAGGGNGTIINNSSRRHPAPAAHNSSYTDDDGANNSKLREWGVSITRLLILAAFVILCAYVFHLYLNYCPKIQIESALVSPLNLNLSSSQITANWTIGISVKNINQRNAVEYKQFKVFVLYGTDQSFELGSARYLGKADIAPFRQGPRKQTKLTAEVRALMQNLNPYLASLIADEVRKGMVSFDLKLEVYLEYRGLIGSTVDEVTGTATCMDVTQLGTTLGGSKECIISQRN